jgi:hypothetical protein
MPSFRGEVKPSVPCRRFAACKRSLQMAWNSPFFGKITGHFLPTVPPFPARGLLCRHRCGGAWQWKRELPKPGSYSKPTWLQYFQGHQPPGPNRIIIIIIISAQPVLHVTLGRMHHDRLK